MCSPPPAPDRGARILLVLLTSLVLASCGEDAVVLDDGAVAELDGGLRERGSLDPADRDGGTHDAAVTPPADAAVRDAAPSSIGTNAVALPGKRAEERASDAGSDQVVSVFAAGVRWIGRVDLSEPGAPRFSWPGSGFVARFRGTGLRVTLDDSAAIRFKVVVDGVPQPTFLPRAREQVLARGLRQGEHTVAIYRQNEAFLGDAKLSDVRVDDGVLLPPPPAPARLIELVGDSISTGSGALGEPDDADCVATQSHWDSYGAVAARALDAELSTVAASGHGVYRDYSGSTTGLLLPRLYERALPYADASTWSFAPQPQVVVINLGTNDVGASDSVPSEPFRAAYRQLVRTVRARYPNARIVGAIGPMLYGAGLETVRGNIAAVMDELRAEGDARVSAFLGFEHQPDDARGCGDHPNVAEHARMGAQLAEELRRLSGW